MTFRVQCTVAPNDLLSRSEQLVGYFYNEPLSAWPTAWLGPN